MSQLDLTDDVPVLVGHDQRRWPALRAVLLEQYPSLDVWRVHQGTAAPLLPEDVDAVTAAGGRVTWRRR